MWSIYIRVSFYTLSGYYTPKVWYDSLVAFSDWYVIHLHAKCQTTSVLCIICLLFYLKQWKVISSSVFPFSIFISGNAFISLLFRHWTFKMQCVYNFIIHTLKTQFSSLTIAIKNMSWTLSWLFIPRNIIQTRTIHLNDQHFSITFTDHSAHRSFFPLVETRFYIFWANT